MGSGTENVLTMSSNYAKFVDCYGVNIIFCTSRMVIYDTFYEPTTKLLLFPPRRSISVTSHDSMCSGAYMTIEAQYC